MRDATRVYRLREQLTRAEARVARLERVSSPGDEVARHFHLGTVGGSGRRVRRLNARKEAALDRIIDAAVALPKARARVAHLRRKIERAEAPPPPAPPAVKRAAGDLSLSPTARARLLEVSRWYLYGDADEEPPFPDITREECDRAVRLRPRLQKAQ